MWKASSCDLAFGGCWVWWCWFGVVVFACLMRFFVVLFKPQALFVALFWGGFGGFGLSRGSFGILLFWWT